MDVEARVSGCDDGRQAAPGVGRECRDERLVLVLPDPRERAAELARVCLAPARDPGHEREEREADEHPPILEPRSLPDGEPFPRLWSSRHRLDAAP